MTTIFVAKLDFGVTENELFELFKQHGKVNKVTIAKDRETQKPKGFAFVEMFDAESANNAVTAIDGHVFNGRNCVVKIAEDRGDKKKDFNKSSNFKKDFKKPNSSGERPEMSNRSSNVVDDRSTTEKIFPGDDLGVSSQKSKRKLKTKDSNFDKDSQNEGPKVSKKMETYKKEKKNNLFLDQEDWEDDEEIDLFGIQEDDDVHDEDLSKYLVNSDEDVDWEDDEEWDEDDEEWDED